jgi:hypothetical protein
VTRRRFRPALSAALAAQVCLAAALPAQTGDSLSVYLLTIGQGDAIWERFGHNAVGIRDPRTNTNIVYNWGLFDFASPGFMQRFIRGEMTYWMAGTDAASEIAGYISRNREVVIQELNLSPAQRGALQEFVDWNAREENKYYRYDYFGDNCSTRVRDALDRVLGGAIRRATDTILTAQSYREEALRLMGRDLLASTGMDVGLGKPADKKMTGWEEMFIPMRLRDQLRDFRIADDSGRMVPLVAGERVIYRARRSPELPDEPNRAPIFLIVGTVIGALLLLTGRRAWGPAAKTGAARSLGTTWGIVIGVVGMLLAFLQLGTQHVWAYWNLNTLAYNPLWLLVAMALPFARPGASAGLLARVGAAISGALTVIALIIACIPPLRQDSLAVLCLAAPANLAAAYIVWRMFDEYREARA